MHRKRVIVGVLALLVGFGWSWKNAYAEEAGHEGAHQAGGRDHSEQELMPGTLQGIWHEVMEGQEQLEATVAAGKLADVHKAAFHIRDLVQTLPKVSGGLSADAQQRLQESINRVAEIAGLLDQYGDAGDAVNTKAQADRLAKLLKYIETFYPEGALHTTHSKGQPETNTPRSP